MKGSAVDFVRYYPCSTWGWIVYQQATWKVRSE